MKTLLTVRNILLAVAALVLLAVLHYSLPQVDVVRAVGVEIKRIDAEDGEGSTNRTRDVYQVQMETPEGDPRVYRNEDNVFYLKFDSADLQAQVQSLAADKQLVALRHYGWRLAVLSAFPNAIKVWPVEEGYRHIPVFNTVVLLLLAALLFFVYRRARRAVTRTRERVETKRLERETAAREKAAASEAAASRDARSAADRIGRSQQKEQDQLDAFLNDDRGNRG